MKRKSKGQIAYVGKFLLSTRPKTANFQGKWKIIPAVKACKKKDA